MSHCLSFSHKSPKTQLPATPEAASAVGDFKDTTVLPEQSAGQAEHVSFVPRISLSQLPRTSPSSVQLPIFMKFVEILHLWEHCFIVKYEAKSQKACLGGGHRRVLTDKQQTSRNFFFSFFPWVFFSPSDTQLKYIPSYAINSCIPTVYWLSLSISYKQLSVFQTAQQK